MDIVEETLNKQIKQLEKLLDESVEETENCYGRDTESTI